MLAMLKEYGFVRCNVHTVDYVAGHLGAWCSPILETGLLADAIQDARREFGVRLARYFRGALSKL